MANTILPAYIKPHLDVSQQIALLRSRGMSISDLSKAKSCLEKIGYYRLSGYWYPFRASGTSIEIKTGKRTKYIVESFKLGTTFSTVHDLYVFDKKLRLLILDALERIEIGLRVEVSLLLSARDRWAHRNHDELDNKFSPDLRLFLSPSNHSKWINKVDLSYTRSQEDFIKEFRKKYSSPLPIWMAIELWDFGTLSTFVVGMKHKDLENVANKYGVARRELFTSWVQALNYIRNVCAHHSRLWNRSLDNQAKPPKIGEISSLDHLVGTRSIYKSYYALAIIQHMMKVVSPNSVWSVRLKEHMLTLPQSEYINLSQAGFPTGWENLPLWA